MRRNGKNVFRKCFYESKKDNRTMTIIAIQRLQNGLLRPITCNKIAFGGENVGKAENRILL